MTGPRIAVIGLGYVGLPLAVEFAEDFDVVGFDTDPRRIAELRQGQDRTGQVPQARIGKDRLTFSDSTAVLAEANVYIVAVPTPVDEHKRPDLTALLEASRMVGELLKPGDIVVYESTVYPGATEEECIPVLEQASGLRLNDDFAVGYSPERVNPGDQRRTVRDVVKVVSASNPSATDELVALYGRIVDAGIHRVDSIRVAEAAKVIENTQRDVNIALVNELALLFDRLGLDTQEVLRAAATKWNFIPFSPGLVGGHCIGVDPYYLTHKAMEVGHYPEVILAGRRINDAMGRHVAEKLVLLMARNDLPMSGSRVLVLGLTFKENCPDTKNTRVLDIVEVLRGYGLTVVVADPHVDHEHAKELGVDLVDLDRALEERYEAAILAVAHDEFTGVGPRLRDAVGPRGVIFDVKGTLGSVADARL